MQKGVLTDLSKAPKPPAQAVEARFQTPHARKAAQIIIDRAERLKTVARERHERKVTKNQQKPTPTYDLIQDRQATQRAAAAALHKDFTRVNDRIARVRDAILQRIEDGQYSPQPLAVKERPARRPPAPDIRRDHHNGPEQPRKPAPARPPLTVAQRDWLDAELKPHIDSRRAMMDELRGLKDRQQHGGMLYRLSGRAAHDAARMDNLASMIEASRQSEDAWREHRISLFQAETASDPYLEPTPLEEARAAVEAEEQRVALEAEQSYFPDSAASSALSPRLSFRQAVGLSRSMGRASERDGVLT